MIQKVSFTDSEDDVPSPPQHLKSIFKNIQEWLFHICDNESPEKSIAQYELGVFESSNENILFLVGINKYSEGENSSRTAIEFEPSNMYLKLPESEYGNLNREQLLDKITFELKEFVNTEKFENSFLAKANAIILQSNGKAIWSK